MAGFNKVKASSKTTSYEGGKVYKQAPITAWLNMLFSSYMEDGFYESAETQRNRFLDLTEKVADTYGYEFVANCAFFARNEIGLRSISQLIAGWLNDKSFEGKRAFYRNFLHRPDDMGEVFSAVDFLGGKRSHALVNGTRDYLSNLNEYQLAKYKMLSRKYNLYDIINITHANSVGIDKLKKNELASADTWEVAISTATSNEDRSQEWIRLVKEEKLGYMALLRNLNNILSAEGVDMDFVRHYLCPQLRNEIAIRKSKVFPYRIYTAYKNLKIVPIPIELALNEAFQIATNNMPQLTGKNGILLDVSGSMDDPISYNSNITIKEVGACFAVAILFQTSDCKIVKFGTQAKKFDYSYLERPFDLVKKLCKNDDCGYGTNIHNGLNMLHTCDSKFDRIFIISDMQVMDANNFYYSSVSPSTLYANNFGRTPAYSFDLGFYGQQVLGNNQDIHCITALNDSVIKMIPLLEENPKAIIEYISSNYSYNY